MTGAMTDVRHVRRTRATNNNNRDDGDDVKVDESKDHHEPRSRKHAATKDTGEF